MIEKRFDLLKRDSLLFTIKQIFSMCFSHVRRQNTKYFFKRLSAKTTLIDQAHNVFCPSQIENEKAF